MPASSLAIAFLNLVVALAFNAVAWGREGAHPATGLVCIFCIFNGILYAQATVLGTLAALSPRRGIIGLLIVSVYAASFGYTLLGVHIALSFNPSGVPSVGIYFALLSIAMLVVLWLSRLLFGWRIATRTEQQPRQFQLSDLLELTMICAVWMGLSIALDNDGMHSRTFVLVFIKFIAQFVLLGLPALFATLAETPPRGRILAALAVWYVVIDFCLYMIPIHDGDFIPYLLRQLPYHAESSLAFLATITASGRLLRRIGYRWRLAVA
ncbi:MAG TPA: hypothetical protein VGI40_06875 [Pirellulaceae bacterium]|jgi:hypothetical protein